MDESDEHDQYHTCSFGQFQSVLHTCLHDFELRGLLQLLDIFLARFQRISLRTHPTSATRATCPATTTMMKNPPICRMLPMHHLSSISLPTSLTTQRKHRSMSSISLPTSLTTQRKKILLRMVSAFAFMSDRI